MSGLRTSDLAYLYYPGNGREGIGPAPVRFRRGPPASEAYRSAPGAARLMSANNTTGREPT